MKYLLLLSFACFVSIGFSQNYQTIKSNQINYFGQQDLEYILATRTDSVEMVGLDSVFYSYKTLRYNDTSTTWNCPYIARAPWYGQKVIIKTSGVNQFFNKDGDTISIHTQAILNDTFLVYQYQNGDWVKGHVFDHDTLTTLGTQDSVKSIQLISNNSTFILQDSTIKIGKNRGFIHVFPFYSFPDSYEYLSAYQDGFLYGFMDTPIHLVGTEHPRVGITRRTRSEIYDLQPGDLTKVSDGYTYWHGGPNSWGISRSENYYTDRVDFGLDSVQLKYDQVNWNKWGYSNPYTLLGDNVSNSYANWVTQVDLAPVWSEFLPEELYLDTANWDTLMGGTVYKNWLGIDNCGVIRDGYTEAFYWQATNECFTPPSYEVWNSRAYYEGLGGPYLVDGYQYYNGGAYDYYGSLYGYEKPGESCGATWFIGLPEQAALTLTLYPNPASGQITLSILKPVESGRLKLTDISGKNIFTQIISDNETTIDVASLPPGMYLITVEIDGRTYQKKLVKN